MSFAGFDFEEAGGTKVVPRKLFRPLSRGYPYDKGLFYAYMSGLLSNFENLLQIATNRKE